MKNSMLLDIIPIGEVNAIKARDMAQILGYNDIRDVTEEIAILRKSGAIICSSSDGYFLPEDNNDIERFYRRTKNRIRELGTILKVVEEQIEFADKGGDN